MVALERLPEFSASNLSRSRKEQMTSSHARRDSGGIIWKVRLGEMYETNSWPRLVSE